MWKTIVVLMLSSLLMACAHNYNMNESRYLVPHQSGDSDERPAHKMHHAEDKKGRNAFPATRTATGKKVFIFDPKVRAWAAYDANGYRVKTGRASGGKHYCADVGRGCKTVVGSFRVHNKRGPECKSNKFPLGKGGAPMPNCMFFHKGYAIHGSYHVPDYNASHGCIRVLPSAASWLNNNFMDVGTNVVVKGY